MIRSNVMKKSTIAEQVQAKDSLADGAMLAAVLAAALVEYGRHLERPNGHNGSQDAAGNWRILGHLDRIQGRA